MTRGIYTAAAGMAAEDAAQQVIADNLANASTTGYKQQIPQFQTFGETLIAAVSDAGVDGSLAASPIGSLGSGASVHGAFTDLSDGPLQQTGNALDVALRGDAYLAVESPAGVAYSRDGALALGASGQLVQASSGLPVLDGQGRPITIPQGAAISIGPTGVIASGGSSVAQLGLYAIDQANGPTKIGDNLIAVAAPAHQIAPSTGSAAYVEEGYLEASNVNIVKEMVTMIACQRSYEANAKAMQSQDSMSDKAISQVGVVG